MTNFARDIVVHAQQAEEQQTALRAVPVLTPAEQDEAYLKQLGLQVRVLRTALHLTQEELAERAGIDRTYVSRLERGQHNVTVLMVARLARALGAEGRELLP